MFEFAGLVVLMLLGGVVVLGLAVVLVPLLLVAKVLGWGIHVAAQGVGWLLGALLLLPLGLLLVPIALLLLPVLALVGGLILLKLAILAAPLLLLLALVVWAVVTLVRRPAAA